MDLGYPTIVKILFWKQSLAGKPPASVRTSPFLALFCVHLFDHSVFFEPNHPSKSVWILDCRWGWMQRKDQPFGLVPRPTWREGCICPQQRHWDQDRAASCKEATRCRCSFLTRGWRFLKPVPPLRSPVPVSHWLNFMGPRTSPKECF